MSQHGRVLLAQQHTRGLAAVVLTGQCTMCPASGPRLSGHAALRYAHVLCLGVVNRKLCLCVFLPGATAPVPTLAQLLSSTDRHQVPTQDILCTSQVGAQHGCPTGGRGMHTCRRCWHE